MSFESHPSFKTPKDENQKIWRYMDLSKFLSMLENSALFLCRIDLYHNSDPFEGTLPKLNIVKDGMNIFNLDNNQLEYKTFDEEPQYKHIHNINIQRINAWKNFIYSNSWFMQDSESNVMWDTYSNSDGVAIQSTYRKLKQSIIDDRKVFIGEINYLDFENESIEENSGFEPFLMKRRSFSQERELRVIHWDTQILRKAAEKYGVEYNNTPYNTPDYLSTKSGHNIGLNLNVLIENIYLSPSAANWQIEIYKALLKRYGINKPIYNSEILKDSYMPK